MNILIYFSGELYPTRGGIERVSNNLAEQLIFKGHQVYFLIKKQSMTNYSDVTVCEMISLEIDNFDDAETVHRISDILLKKKIEIILNQKYSDCEFPIFIKENFNIPLITAIHSTPDRFLQAIPSTFNMCSPIFSIAKLKELRRVLLAPHRISKEKDKTKKHYSEMYANSDRIVLLSEYFSPVLHEFVSFEDEKITSIPNFNTFIYEVADSWQAKKEKTILYVGRLIYQAKRVDRLIKVWEKLYDKYPHWKLRIAGDGPEKVNIERYIKRKGIKNVELLGFVQPEEEYKKASIFCMTSTFEGFGMVLIEAGMYGCVPMAFSSYASIYDIIDDGINGVLVDPFD